MVYGPPAVATAGSNVLPTIPVPLNVPPKGEPVKVTAGAFKHIVAGNPLKLTTGKAFTVISPLIDADRQRPPEVVTW
jgi:hypothetical protein